MHFQAELNGESVFARTPEGQQQVIDCHLELSEPLRRMLLLVNGYTPLAHLADLLDAEAATKWPVVPSSVPESVQALLQRGLITQVDPATQDPVSTVSPAFEA
jgi:hypothetical protein